jgi:D-aspartate ligase
MTKSSHPMERPREMQPVSAESAVVAAPAHLTGTANSTLEALPAVIILNLFYTGIAIARDLAGRGVRIVGLTAHRNSPGNRTRLCEVRFSPNSHEQPDELVEFLLKASSELSGAVIFPTRDLDVLFLDRYRDVLGRHYRLAIPDRESLYRVIDKYALACIAQKADLPVPKTMTIRSECELRQVPNQIGFPCVMKPVSSYQWREGENWDVVGGRKAFLVESMEMLAQEYEMVRHAHQEVLVQEWVPGGTENIVVIGAYVGANAEPLAYFTARKIVQSPDEYFGTGCIVRSEDIPELLEPTRRLWKALDYRGMAEVEYKFDPRSNEYKLIEINTRHWDQHELGRASGVNLSWSAYADLTGIEATTKKVATVGTTWIGEDALIRHVLEGFYRGKIELKKLWKQLQGPRIYGIFSWRDPVPFMHHCATVTVPALAKQFLRSFTKNGSRDEPVVAKVKK